MRRIYEDAGVVAIDKPAGVPTIPGRGAIGVPVSETLHRELGRVWVVHRLDRDASGVVVFAKTAAAHRRLSQAFESRQAKKTYLLLVEGEVTAAGEIAAPLKEYGSGRIGVAKEGGKPCLTRYRPLAAGRGCTLVEAEPLTGRRHQLRVHLYSAGHAILGDPLYGQPRPVGGAPRLMLHAASLTLPGLPAIVSEPPEDFRTVLAARGVPANFSSSRP